MYISVTFGWFGIAGGFRAGLGGEFCGGDAIAFAFSIVLWSLCFFYCKWVCILFYFYLIDWRCHLWLWRWWRIGWRILKILCGMIGDKFTSSFFWYYLWLVHCIRRWMVG